MVRTSPRVETELPISLIIDGGSAVECVAINLGMGGAFIESSPTIGKRKLLEIQVVQINFNLPKIGEINIWGRVIRSAKGFAIQFVDLSEREQFKLWQYLTEHLKDIDECPYCGKKPGHLGDDCNKCGNNLDFVSTDYYQYLKREELKRSLISAIHNTSDGHLHKISELLKQETPVRDGVIYNDGFEGFFGTCKPIMKVLDQVRRVASTDIPVLITGEEGTGKESIARLIHEKSFRKDNPFVPVSCAAIPETLLEVELFGYDKGSYSGPNNAKKGKIEYADSGTLYLDEVVELPRDIQTRLLSLMGQQAAEGSGADISGKFDIRVIAAANTDLEDAFSQESLLPDLLGGLEAFKIHLVPLRDREEDIALSAQYFLKKFSSEMSFPVKGFTREAIKWIIAYSWPENFKEMIKKIRRAIIMSQGDKITAEDLELGNSEAIWLRPLGEMRTSIERDLILEVLTRNNYNISRSAKALNISRPHLYNLMKKCDIKKCVKFK